MSEENQEKEITAEELIDAYKAGLFPMATSRNDENLYWFNPEMRGILPLNKYKVPESLKKFMKKMDFEIRVNYAFPKVISACAERESTWINTKIIQLYTTLWAKGYAHSIECWQAGKLVGGLYGVAINGAFFGESMFSRVPNASKVALVKLLEILKEGNFALLDIQYINEHLEQFGAVEIPRERYMRMLFLALKRQAEFKVV